MIAKRSIGVLVVACTSVVARADTPQDYPYAVVDRPLTLPRSLFEATASVDLTQADPSESAGAGLVGYTANTTGMAVGGQLEASVGRRWQVGASLAFPLTDFGQLVASVQYALADPIALRLDVGYLRAITAADTADGGNSPGSDHMAYLAVGARLKYKLNRTIALTSGITRSPGIAITSGPYFLGSIGDPQRGPGYRRRRSSGDAHGLRVSAPGRAAVPAQAVSVRPGAGRLSGWCSPRSPTIRTIRTIRFRKPSRSGSTSV